MIFSSYTKISKVTIIIDFLFLLIVAAIKPHNLRTVHQVCHGCKLKYFNRVALNFHTLQLILVLMMFMCHKYNVNSKKDDKITLQILIIYDGDVHGRAHQTREVLRHTKGPKK